MEHVKPTLTLSNPPAIPNQYIDTITRTLLAYYSRMRWNMQQNLGFYQLPPVIEPTTTPFAETLAAIARAAAGELEYNDYDAVLILEAIQATAETLFASPVSYSYHIPAAFWDTDLGQMIARARLWIAQDDLITQTDAATLRGVSVQAISQAITARRLTGYRDPDATGKAGRVLVSRKEVEGM